MARDPDRWCLTMSYRNMEPKQGVVGSGWQLRFFRWDPARLKQVIPFRAREETRERINLPLAGYDVAHKQVTLPLELSLDEQFRRHLRSADALRDAYVTDLDRLEAFALAVLREHRAYNIEPGTVPRTRPRRSEGSR